MDLADFTQLADNNEGNKFLLLGVDVLSKRFFGVPVKSKSTTHMIAAFEDLFKQMPMLPKRIYTDRGLEFESKIIKQFFADKHIEKLAAQNVETKAAVAERGIQTVKNRIYKWFSEKNRMDWIAVLPQILRSINNTRSRVTGMAPNKINERNAAQLVKRIWGPDKERMEKNLKMGKKMAPKIQKGEMVRRVEPRQIFDKGYFPRNSDMIYQVKEVHGTLPPRYTVVDWEGKGKELKKKFYTPQLIKLHRDADTSFRVDKVLRQRTRGGKKQFLVTYIGYPGQKSWINEDDFF